MSEYPLATTFSKTNILIITTPSYYINKQTLFGSARGR